MPMQKSLKLIFHTSCINIMVSTYYWSLFMWSCWLL